MVDRYKVFQLRFNGVPIWRVIDTSNGIVIYNSHVADDAFCRRNVMNMVRA